MKTHAMVLASVLVGLAMGCEDARRPGPAGLQMEPASEDAMELLPATTLAAMEFLELDRRWDELRSIPGTAALQNRLLDRLDLEPAELPLIVGSRAVVALVADDSGLGIVPVAVLDRPSPNAARQSLSESETLFAVEARGALWVGARVHRRRVEAIAVGDGTSFRRAMDVGSLDQRLPAGGLVRVVAVPRSIARWLRRWAEYRATSPWGALARLIAGDLEAIAVAGLRRDIENGELVTDAWLGIDPDVIPAPVSDAMAADRGPAALPSPLPPDVLIAKSFRTEPAAGLAWLRTLAARDPEGPLRQLDFWIDEFEARSGRDVERDIVATLGERGWALALDDGHGDVELVAIIEARDPERLEAALLDLRDWLGEHIHARTLGLARWRGGDGAERYGESHGFALWSPFGDFSGPVFQLTDEHLVVASGERALSFGLALAASASRWMTPGWAQFDGPADEIAVLRLNRLGARLAGTPAPAASPGQEPWMLAVAEFFRSAGEARLRVDYSRHGIRISGQLDLDADTRE